MKQFLLISFCTLMMLTTPASSIKAPLEQPHEVNHYYQIPDEAVRLRILANSNSTTDQALKYKVRDKVNAHIHQVVKEIDDIDVARKAIEREIPAVEQVVANTLHSYEVPYSYEVRYESDVPFPTKTYGPYVYPAGEYEAVFITLGDGLGDNWWCVLFPPLCFIDFFGGTNVAEHADEDDSSVQKLDSEEEETEVRFFLFDLFKS